MKPTYKWLTALTCLFLLGGCNDEWNDEQYEKYISFVHSGDNRVYLKYEAQGGNKTYHLPVQISGSQSNSSDVRVTIAVDPDTLVKYNFDNFRSREDLYFKELDAKHYALKSWSATIPAGSTKTSIDIDFSFLGLDNFDKHMLPLSIDASSELMPNPNKHYKKSLMQIILFNDYSGKYEVTAEMTEVNNDGHEVGDKIKVESRNSWVEDENTVFFYAGFTEEQAIDRKDYRVYAKFEKRNELSGIVELYTDNPDMELTWVPAECFFIIQEEMDELQPYLKRRYITMNVNYTYLDISNKNFPIRYKYAGTMILERVLNILMPEEDQYIFD